MVISFYNVMLTEVVDGVVVFAEHLEGVDEDTVVLHADAFRRQCTDPCSMVVDAEVSRV